MGDRKKGNEATRSRAENTRITEKIPDTLLLGCSTREARMGFRRSDLQEAFFVAGTYGFRVWAYGTTDALDEVVRQDYFEKTRGILRPGELIYVGTCPQTQTEGFDEDAMQPW
jgi:hypothetical protein